MSQKYPIICVWSRRASLQGCVYGAEGSMGQKPPASSGQGGAGTRKSCSLAHLLTPLLTSQQQSSLQAVWQQAEHHVCPLPSSQALLMHRLFYTNWEIVPGLSLPEKSHPSPIHCWSAFLGSFLFNPGLVPASWVTPLQQSVPYDVGAVGSKPPGILEFTSLASWECFVTHAVKKRLSPYSQRDYRKWRCSASSTNLNPKKGEISETTHYSAVLLAWIFVQCVSSHLELLNFSISISCTGKIHDYTSAYWGACISSRHRLDA